MFEHLQDYTADARVSTVDLGGVTVGAFRYETMVFGGQFDDYCMRYRTTGQAREGHRETLEKVLNAEAGFYTTETPN